MKKRVFNLFAVLSLAGVFALSSNQFNVPVCGANGCPSNPFPECDCNLIDFEVVQVGQNFLWRCTYGCFCPSSGGGDPFYIERTNEYWQ